MAIPVLDFEDSADFYERVRGFERSKTSIDIRFQSDDSRAEIDKLCQQHCLALQVGAGAAAVATGGAAVAAGAATATGAASATGAAASGGAGAAALAGVRLAAGTIPAIPAATTAVSESSVILAALGPRLLCAFGVVGVVAGIAFTAVSVYKAATSPKGSFTIVEINAGGSVSIGRLTWE